MSNKRKNKSKRRRPLGAWDVIEKAIRQFKQGRPIPQILKRVPNRYKDLVTQALRSHVISGGGDITKHNKPARSAWEVDNAIIEAYQKGLDLAGIRRDSGVQDSYRIFKAIKNVNTININS